MTGNTRRGPSRELAAAGPELVRVIRPGHPLHGLDLPVWGRLRLRGAAMAVVVLPDGSKKRIPAAWTRAGDGTGTAGPAAGIIAPASDLLRLLRVISGISGRSAGTAEQAARQSPGKEDNRAACTTESAAGPGSGATITAGRPAAPAHRASRGRDLDAPDHPCGATRIAGRARGAGSGPGRRDGAGGERR
jgi:hypothetical protein